jgi:hypothetical protein
MSATIDATQQWPCFEDNTYAGPMSRGHGSIQSAVVRELGKSRRPLGRVMKRVARKSSTRGPSRNVSPKHHGSAHPPLPLEIGEPSVAVGPVAAADVPDHRERDLVPALVVGVLDDELLDRPEVALDAAQVAGVGGSRDQLDVRALGPLPDLGRLVAGEVVQYHVEPQARVVAHPHRGQEAPPRDRPCTA